MLRWRPLIAAAVLALAGCGGGAEPVRAPGGVVEVQLVDFRVRPQIVHVKKGRLEFRVRNAGRLPHNFRIRGTGGTRMKIRTLLPGTRAARSGIRLNRGDFRMFCSIANHEELGMYGTLVVR